MFKKPVWDNLCFVTWCIILLEVAIRRWVHCSYNGMDMVSNNTQVAVEYKRCSIGTKGPKVCQENIPHTITPPTPPAWTVETRQDGSMLSCTLSQIQIQILRPACLAQTTIPRSKSLKSPFFPILMLGLNFRKSSSPHLDAHMHWVAAMWLAD